jgi:ATP-binding cassette subfamily F protein uup
LLLLDEPTNHIDLPTIDWLEKKLLSLNKTLIIVSHDQEFLRKIATKTFWIHQAQILKREGLYNNFQNWTNEIIEVEKIKSHKLKQKIKSEKKWAIEGISARRKRNMGRLRDLEKLFKNYESTKEIVKKPLNLVLNKTNESGLNIIETFDLSFSYDVNNGNLNIFSDLNLKIRRNDRIGIIGANGSGKSTLVKILQGICSPKTGKIKFGENVNIKYFDQNKENINLNKTPWSTLAGNGDHVDFMGDKIHVLSYLKKFLFDEKKSLQSNSTLSGGEKVRLSLAELFINKHNFLILDEPTNDLDFDTLDLLKVVIKNYDGTVLIISHDRFFLDNTVEKLLVFENNNRILKHEGNFSDYYRKFGLEKLIIVNNNGKNKISNKKTTSKKVINKKKMSFKDSYYLEKLPLKIEKLEKELKEYETILNDRDLFKNDRKTFDKATTEITNIKKIINESENKWLELQILNDEINNL